MLLLAGAGMVRYTAGGGAAILGDDDSRNSGATGRGSTAVPFEVNPARVSETSHEGMERGVHTPAASSVGTQPRLPMPMAAASKPPKIVPPWGDT